MITKTLKPGDKLPPEVELARTFFVSRNAVREAIKMLVALGVVEIRRGDGTYVTQTLSSSAIDPLIFTLILNHKMPKQLFEFRKMLEIGILDIVMAEVTPGDIENMERAIQNFEKDCREGVTDEKKLCQDDLEFHYAFGAATHNPLIIKLAYTIWEMFAPSIKRASESFKKKKTSQIERGPGEHRMILEAIKEKNLEKAKRAVYKSLDSWREDSWKKLG